MNYKLLSSCRACGGSLSRLLDLGETPLANTYMPTREEALALPRYPLRLCVCSECSFVQLDVSIPGEVLFRNYTYETPRSEILALHYQNLFEICRKHFGMFGPGSVVLEMGSNNGAFLKTLQPYVKQVVGVEPAENIESSVPTIRTFFTKDTAQDLPACDVFVARHCMAHLDDLRGTLEGVAHVLKDDGFAIIENAYFMPTMQGGQFDQIYHEHHSYFLVGPLATLLESVGLYLHNVLSVRVHGGSIVLIVGKRPPYTTAPTNIPHLLEDEQDLVRESEEFVFRVRAGIAGLHEGLRQFAFRTLDTYGATAKGNTLLNVLGPDAVHVRYAVDSTPTKQGKYLPGTGIKVISEAEAHRDRPDAYLLTAWNYADEIMNNYWATDPRMRFILPFPYPHFS